MLKGKNAKALEVLNKLANADEAKIVLAEIDASLKETSGKLFAYGGLVLFVGIMLSLFQQFVGINAVLYYGPQMFKNMGFEANASLLQTVIMGIVMVVFTLVATATVDKWGRKPLLILGALIMAVSMIALGFLFYSGNVGLAALVVVCIYIAGFSLSWGPVVWVMLAEIFPNNIRNKAMAIAVAAQWIANLFVSWTFNILDSHSALTAVVQPRLRVLAVWRREPGGGRVRVEIRAGDQGQDARSHARPVARGAEETGLACNRWNPAVCLHRGIPFQNL